MFKFCEKLNEKVWQPSLKSILKRTFYIKAGLVIQVDEPKHKYL